MLYYPPTYPIEKNKLIMDTLEYILKNKNDIESRKDLFKAIRFYLAKQNSGFFPKLWMLYFAYLRFFENKAEEKKLINLLKVVKTRSISGIAPLSVFTKPEGSCPYNCVYCPIAENAPKSYFPDEAAVMRAIRADYDPFQQTQDRLIQFYLSGHSIEKIDLIIQGGTFSFYPRSYRREFVKRVFDACNADIEYLIKTGDTTAYLKDSKDIIEAKEKNRYAKSKIVGITIETRPDFINKEELKFLREIGTTRVELGVQTTDPKILQLIKRGHTLDDLVRATYLLKEAGFKITYHLMPGLPGSNTEKDIEMLAQIFEDERFKPDSIKFYPTQVVYNSQLLEWYKKGRYTPLSEKELIEIVCEFKKRIVPEWLRIHRLVRDLTKNDVAVHTFPSNFRQNLAEVLKKKGISCPCIRCREIRGKKPVPPFKLNILKYKASGGKEFFFQYTDMKNKLLGFLRLRIPKHSKSKKEFFFKNISSAALIRELHIYGESTPLNIKGKTQHQGLGKKLIKTAEKLAKENNCKKIAVISGVGVREYYKKLGYSLEKETEYMIKNLN